MKPINLASAVRDLLRDIEIAAGRDVRFGTVDGTARLARINASLNTERNWS